ncbi:hypothetical protein ACLB2K_059785 [Fragaria x ananassa]
MRDWVSRNGLVDLGYQGANYTWSNNAVKERLNRSFCNSDWTILFPDACLIHLARMKSDHCPILVKLFPSIRGSKKNSPFRFQAKWLNHENYSDMVSETWNNCSGDLLSKTSNLANSLIDWNKNVFGNIFKQKRIINARICGIHKCLGRGPNLFLQNLEKKLIVDYEKIRDAEAIFWKQKSRDKWLREGDRNTKFFHLTTIVRRRRNKIDGLYNANGVCTTDMTGMQQIAVDFFHKLFTAEPVKDLRVIIPSLFPKIPNADMIRMNRPITEHDIHSALFRIGKFKAPRVDGFLALFFQQHWNLCAAEIISVVTQAFSSGTL